VNAVSHKTSNRFLFELYDVYLDKPDAEKSELNRHFFQPIGFLRCNNNNNHHHAQVYHRCTRAVGANVPQDAHGDAVAPLHHENGRDGTFGHRFFDQEWDLPLPFGLWTLWRGAQENDGREKLPSSSLQRQGRPSSERSCKRKGLDREREEWLFPVEFEVGVDQIYHVQWSEEEGLFFRDGVNHVAANHVAANLNAFGCPPCVPNAQPRLEMAEI
jgi:hypothetical protein